MSDVRNVGVTKQAKEAAEKARQAARLASLRQARAKRKKQVCEVLDGLERPKGHAFSQLVNQQAIITYYRFKLRHIQEEAKTESKPKTKKRLITELAFLLFRGTTTLWQLINHFEKFGV